MKAFGETEAGRMGNALDLYRRILLEFPESRFVPDAHMALAESRFTEAEFGEALARYNEVLRYRESELYGLALFKSAWCLWRMNRTTESARRFPSGARISGGGAATGSSAPSSARAFESFRAKRSST